MGVWIDGQTDGQVDEWMGECMDDGWVDGQAGGQMDGWIDKGVCGWMGGQMVR